MNKRKRVAMLKHRVRHRKMKLRYRLAKQLIDGKLTRNELNRVAGLAVQSVLRIASLLSKAKGQAAAPAGASRVPRTAPPVESPKPAPSRAGARRAPATAQAAPEVEKAAVAEAPKPAPSRARARRAVPTTEVAPQAEELAEPEVVEAAAEKAVKPRARRAAPSRAASKVEEVAAEPEGAQAVAEAPTEATETKANKRPSRRKATSGTKEASTGEASQTQEG